MRVLVGHGVAAERQGVAGQVGGPGPKLVAVPVAQQGQRPGLGLVVDDAVERGAGRRGARLVCEGLVFLQGIAGVAGGQAPSVPVEEGRRNVHVRGIGQVHSGHARRSQGDSGFVADRVGLPSAGEGVGALTHAEGVPPAVEGAEGVDVVAEGEVFGVDGRRRALRLEGGLAGEVEVLPHRPVVVQHRHPRRPEGGWGVGERGVVALHDVGGAVDLAAEVEQMHARAVGVQLDDLISGGLVERKGAVGDIRGAGRPGRGDELVRSELVGPEEAGRLRRDAGSGAGRRDDHHHR